MSAPLSGIRVVEVANWLAAPSATALMRDLGADVIKVEPPGGDVYRGFRPEQREGAAPPPIKPQFELDNRGKRSITVDLGTPDGPDVVQALLRRADVFLTNLTAPRQHRFRLDAEAALAAKPGLVHVSFSGYGGVGLDFSAFWARAGIMALIGEAGTPPAMCRGGQGDHTTALNLLAATLAALRLRERDGAGQVVEVSLQHTGAWTIASDLSQALLDRRQPQRRDRRRPPNPLFNSYTTGDGRWLILTMPLPDPYWGPFCRAIGEPGWEQDPRFDSLAQRRENGPLLGALIEERFRRHDRAHWAGRLDAHGIIWAPIAELPEVVEDPQLRALGAFSVVDHPRAGRYETLSAPFRIRGADIAVRGPAPDPGQHSAEILAEHGFDAERIADLAAGGVFG